MTPDWVRLGVVDSTNDEAARLARKGAPDGTLVTAKAQVLGRGRRGATFVSPPGNFYGSWILRPSCPASAASQLGFVAGLAVADAIAAFAPAATRIELKWPNDVHADGGKIAGILLEAETAGTTLAWVVLGIGINVASHPEGLPFPATSFAALGASGASPDAVAERLIAALASWRARWRDDGFGPIRTAWLARAKGVGGDVRVALDGGSFGGRFADLDADGALVVALADGGRRRVTAGDVFFAGAR